MGLFSAVGKEGGGLSLQGRVYAVGSDKKELKYKDHGSATLKGEGGSRGARGELSKDKARSLSLPVSAPLPARFLCLKGLWGWGM